LPDTEDIFQRETEAGWVIVSSDVPRLGGPYSDLPERLLSKMDLSRLCVCVAAGEILTPDLDAFLEDIEILLGTPVSLWRLEEEPPAEMAGAGLLILVGGIVEEWTAGLDNTLMGELVLQSLNQGGVIFAIGSAAAAMGTWAFPTIEDDIAPALQWLPGALILPGEASPSDLDNVRQLLEDQPKAYALGLSEASLVAFGPAGEIEVWGEAQPRLILGSGWSEE
jgi:hypothetical protein